MTKMSQHTAHESGDTQEYLRLCEIISVNSKNCDNTVCPPMALQ